MQWNKDADPRELPTAEAIREAEDEGIITIEESEIVVNMPVLVWAGDHR